MLERLLRSLKYQESGGLFDIAVVVVDNDDTGSARDTVMRLRDELNMEIEYGIETERTIPAARNHALRLARGNYIGIIDDDEFSPPQWLFTLYQAIQTFNVSGALGPVRPFFEQRPPAWLIKGRFCERPVHRTGTLLDWNQTRTGNVLLKREVFDEHQIQFDLKWKTSGSDRAFFKKAMQLGYRFVAVEEAPVYEIVPPERWYGKYYFRRALVQGFNSSRNISGKLSGLTRLIQTIKSLIAVIIYIVAVPFCACFGKHIFVKCIERGGHHFSRLCAMVGIELIKKRDF